MSLALLQSGLSALSVDVLKTAQAAYRVAGSMAAASSVIARMNQSVGYNNVDRQAAENMLAAFTRRDQSVGMNDIDRAIAKIYATILTRKARVGVPGG